MQPPRHSGSFQAVAERFGSHLTCDFIASKLDYMAGIHGARDVFVVKDVYSVYAMHSPPSRVMKTRS
eukprot:2557611-Alexandrium_andersonii.AAC.1